MEWKQQEIKHRKKHINIYLCSLGFEHCKITRTIYGLPEEDAINLDCDLCAIDFLPEDTKNHGDSNKKVENKFPCTLCDKVYIHASSLANHIRDKHRRTTSYKCIQCGKTYMNYRTLTTHIKRNHS